MEDLRGMKEELMEENSRTDGGRTKKNRVLTWKFPKLNTDDICLDVLLQQVGSQTLCPLQGLL